MTVPFASTSNQELYIIELVDGEIPEAPEFIGIPFVSHTLTQNTGQIDSNTIRSGRHKLPSRRGANAVSGDINVELGYGVYDALIEAAFCGTWDGKILAGTTLSAAAADSSFNDSDSGFVDAGFVVGDVITVTGFATAANNGRFKIASVAAGKITVTDLSGDPVTLADEAAGKSVTIQTEAVLKTGSTRREFAILERHTDIGVDILYTGCEVNTFNLTLPLTEKITATFGIVGKGMEEYELPNDAVLTPATEFDYLTTLDGDLKEGGASTGLATNLTVNLANGIEQKYGLMSRDPVGSTIGTIDATGSISAYFESMALYNKFLNGTDTTLLILMGNTEAPQGQYELSIPKTRLTTGNKSASGQDVIVELGFSAAYQEGSSELILKRIPA